MDNGSEKVSDILKENSSGNVIKKYEFYKIQSWGYLNEHSVKNYSSKMEKAFNLWKKIFQL